MYLNKENTLCFSGHRSEKLPKTDAEMEKLKLRIWEEVDKTIGNGIDTFYFGACYGFDLMCADIVAKRKRVIKMSDPKVIKLIAVIPFENQAIRWKESDRELYYDTLPLCDDVITLNTHYKQDCYYERNRYMVD
ncbi:MAG: SLOG family protein, partial [Anaerorhabdus sp.]|uniref:SLOG family protein n=1 Tax=Anaerorhabdus sp. TaxID=1872524 RepID=UPI002FC99E75